MLNSIFAESITLLSILIMLGTAVILGILNSIVFGYKSHNTKSFALTLALLPLISSVIIFLVNDHLGVSVAVAGAFTLVRFRSIKGTGREIVSIFASMAIGLVLGMGYIGFGIIVFMVIALVTLILTSLDFGSSKKLQQVRVTIPEDLDYNGIFDDIFTEFCTSKEVSTVRTKNMGTLFEITYAVTFKDHADLKAFMDSLRVRNGNLPIVVGDFPEDEHM